ncbi:hypothetical protein S40293_04201 [Stachybotrys chartarum IBT 40293]|nr:hypothetical protein S40293_04201 [Stachybotrys chartarum IBT 40293]
MSLSLTQITVRPIIDLASPFPSIPSTRFTAIRDGPPAKRQRVDADENEDDTLRERFKAFVVHYIVPCVSRAVQLLSPRQYRINHIAVEAIEVIARSQHGYCWDATRGAYLLRDEAKLAAYVFETVQQLASLPENQVCLHHITSIDRTTIVPTRSSIIPTPHIPRNDTWHYPSAFSSRLRTKASSFHNRSWRPKHLETCHARTAPRVQHRRPYLSKLDRESVIQGLQHGSPDLLDSLPAEPRTYHVDFTSDEISHLIELVLKYLPSHNAPRTKEYLANLCLAHNIPSMVEDNLPGRTTEDIRNFCLDLLAENTSSSPLALSLPQRPRIQHQQHPTGAISSLLFARELEGNRGFGRMRRLRNFQRELTLLREDDLQVVSEFTNCAGDISTLSWVSNGSFLCGTTAHSDNHNQQYNKPGNLLLCSPGPMQDYSLRAFPDHRVPRPRVEEGENSTDAMRQSQDPWLYSSVVSSDYDGFHDFAYTSSFDATVKVWRIQQGSMVALATWPHQGNVNFVVAAKDDSGYVATAADIPSQAVRIYKVDPNNIQNSSYRTLSCSRTDADGSDKWAYFPATMQWGRALGSRHILAIGYSPRSLTGDDQDIPEDKRKTGEIVLWDATTGLKIPVSNATTANVFEVAWHPTAHCFLVATSPCGLSVKPGIRTQIHLFHPDKTRPAGWFAEFQNLDCKASDINEITMVPNSPSHSYVTAACTDGKVYVWDTAQGDEPIHTLEHGKPVDEVHGDREREDTGVKLTAWGSTPDRLYTGSSDGVVKVWNVRNAHRPFVRDLLEAPGPISVGAFSQDYAKLAIGDATGRVFLLGLDQPEEATENGSVNGPLVTIPGLRRQVRRPMPFIPHPEPAPPNEGEDSSLEIGKYSRRQFLDSQQLVIHPNPVIGAVQGPAYETTNLYRREAHVDEDPRRPLIADFDRQQRRSILSGHGRRRSLRRTRLASLSNPDYQAAHRANLEKDFDPARLDASDLADLVAAGAELSLEDRGWDFALEEMPAAYDD